PSATSGRCAAEDFLFLFLAAYGLGFASTTFFVLVELLGTVPEVVGLAVCRPATLILVVVVVLPTAGAAAAAVAEIFGVVLAIPARRGARYTRRGRGTAWGASTRSDRRSRREPSARGSPRQRRWRATGAACRRSSRPSSSRSDADECVPRPGARYGDPCLPPAA